MTTGNMGAFMRNSVSPFIKNRWDNGTLKAAAAYGGAGAAMMLGGSMYNRSEGGATWGGTGAQMLGAAGMFMGAKRAGMGTLMTAGGMQRMGNRFQNAASRTVGGEGRGLTEKMLGATASGMYGASDMMHAHLSKNKHFGYNTKMGNHLNTLNNGYI
jgi:hypothetical protein